MKKQPKPVVTAIDKQISKKQEIIEILDRITAKMDKLEKILVKVPKSA
jgi:hypothetical protein